MATFKYLGEVARPGLVATYGPTSKITIRKKDGTKLELTPVEPATELEPNVYITPDVTDERALRALQADPRFQEQV